MTPSAAIEDAYPLTPMQEGMLFHALDADGFEPYVVQLCCRIGGLEATHWRKAWASAIRRHAALRTAFAWKSQRNPLQLVGSHVEMPIPELDWRGLTDEEIARRIEAWRLADRRTAYDLARAPLMRATLYRTGVDEHWFTWSFHHILLDAWSASMLLGEVLEAYEAIGRGRSPRSDPAPLFRSYVEHLGRMPRQTAERFWRKALAELTPQLPLPFATPVTSPSVSMTSADPYGEECVKLSSADTDAIQAFGRDNKLTLSTLLRGAWGLLLCRLTQSRDVLFGAVVSGRPPELCDIERMIGLFVNTVPVRVRVPGDCSVREWLKQLHGDMVDATPYQYASLAKILGCLDTSAERSPIDSILIVENLPAALKPTDKQTTLRVDRQQTYWKTSYPLSVMAVPGPELKLQLAYDRRRHEGRQAQQLLRCMTTLLRGFVAMPDADPWALPLVDAREAAYARMSGAARPEFAQTPAHELFETVARRAGESTALICGTHAFRYDEIAVSASRVASALRRVGIGAHARVALCLERSEALVVAVLGVLRVGACYVPLDPSHPLARLGHMIDDAGCTAIIADRRTRGLAEQAAPSRLVLALDDLLSAVGEESTHVAVRPEDLAYIIYTSGSSGRPKGVAVPHRALANVLRSIADESAMTADDRLLAVTTVAFDIAALELLLPLTTGATLVLATQDDSRDANALMLRIQTSKPTFVQATPTLWQMLIDSGWQGDAGLTAFCGGESLTADLAAALTERCRSVWNLYGPTETTIWSMVERIRPGQRRIALGKPIANTDILLVDDGGQPPPPGLPGEIFIGGLGLAEGYVNAPDLTKEKFVRDGSGSDLSNGGADVRLFRTGDLARYDPDAGLCFIGRRDDQLKVRGFRVTAGEIEARLNIHPRVRAAAVAVRELQGTPALIAYIIAREPSPGADWPAALDPADLRRHLCRDLPDYMVPTLFVPVDDFPRTANGKLDRRALPTPDPSRLGLVTTAGKAAGVGPSTTSVMRRSPIVEILENLWRELLGPANLGPDDNFFVLGGHSLLAMRLVNRLNRTLGLQLPVRCVFERPTIAGLQALINAELGCQGGTCEEPIVAGPAEPTPLSFQQRRLWFIEQLLTEAAPYNLHAAVRVEGTLDRTLIARSLSAVVARHAVLRTRVAAHPDGPLQIPRDVGPALVEVDYRTMRPEIRDLAITRDLKATIAARFDLCNDESCRVSLLQLEDRVHLLLFVLHHIVADEWSMAILVDELWAEYGALVRGTPSPLAPLSLQYTDFARWQHRTMTRAALAPHVAYWRQRLAGVRPLDLPFARPREGTQTFTGTTLFFRVEPPVVALLKQVNLREECTLFATLLAAFRCLLYRETGQGDAAIGTVVAGRDREELEPLVGFFSNTIALRTKVSDDCTFRDVLRREFEGIVAAWPHVQVPFEQVVEALALPRDRSRNPVFQVMLVLQNMPAAALSIEGLRLTPVLLDGGSVEFDLLLEMYEADRGLQLRLSFNSMLFDRATMLRFGNRYMLMLAAIAHETNTRVAAVPLAGADDHVRIVRDFTDHLDSERTV